MLGEIPAGFNNYELVGEKNSAEGEHGYRTWDILNTIIQYANFKVLADFNCSVDILFANQPSNAINIFAESISSEQSSKEQYVHNNSEYVNYKNNIKKENFMLFVS